MADRELVVQAIEEAQRILAEYIAPGRRDAAVTVKALLDVLGRRDVVAALNRLALQPHEEFRRAWLSANSYPKGLKVFCDLTQPYVIGSISSA